MERKTTSITRNIWLVYGNFSGYHDHGSGARSHGCTWNWCSYCVHLWLLKWVENFSRDLARRDLSDYSNSFQYLSSADVSSWDIRGPSDSFWCGSINSATICFHWGFKRNVLTTFIRAVILLLFLFLVIFHKILSSQDLTFHRVSFRNNISFFFFNHIF